MTEQAAKLEELKRVTKRAQELREEFADNPLDLIELKSSVESAFFYNVVKLTLIHFSQNRDMAGIAVRLYDEDTAVEILMRKITQFLIQDLKEYCPVDYQLSLKTGVELKDFGFIDTYEEDDKIKTR